MIETILQTTNSQQEETSTNNIHCLLKDKTDRQIVVSCKLEASFENDTHTGSMLTGLPEQPYNTLLRYISECVHAWIVTTSGGEVNSYVYSCLD